MINDESFDNKERTMLQVRCGYVVRLYRHTNIENTLILITDYAIII